MEVNQGSPLVGSLSINGQVIIKEQGFGGPLLYFNRKIYIPVFIRRFWVVGFRLATLNLDDLSIEYIGGIEDLVYLKEIKGNRIYFYTDIYKSTERNLTLYDKYNSRLCCKHHSQRTSMLIKFKEFIQKYWISITKLKQIDT